MQGQGYMGLPLPASQATCAPTPRGHEDALQSPQAAPSTVLKETVKTQHGTYSFNMVLTERESCSAADSWQAGDETAGRHPGTGRPTLLLLHGFMGCAADWEHVAASLAVTCRCITVDLPGHGATEVSADGVLVLQRGAC